MILFVCTGNTCRSPMAAALARKAGIDAQSAGLYALPGAPATSAAIRAAAACGADLSAHRAQAVNAELLSQAQAVYVMTAAHAQALCAAFPFVSGKTHVLEPAIPDPYGGDDDTYEHCIRQIKLALRRAGILE